jgi:predicted amidohydrolase YtcJ
MQSSHQTSDMMWAQARVGPERIVGAYAWHSLLATGVKIANGTDFPVERVDPLITYHSAVTRENGKNEPPGGWYPRERMSREEALESMTIWAARAGFQEKLLGSIAVGKYADWVVLDRDIVSVPAEQILGTHVLQTVVGGKTVYRAPSA